VAKRTLRLGSKLTVFAVGSSQGSSGMLRNTFRGILGLVFVAAATWLANYITERIFGPEDPDAVA
jgi:hypothetical protein